MLWPLRRALTLLALLASPAGSVLFGSADSGSNNTKKALKRAEEAALSTAGKAPTARAPKRARVAKQTKAKEPRGAKAHSQAEAPKQARAHRHEAPAVLEAEAPPAAALGPAAPDVAGVPRFFIRDLERRDATGEFQRIVRALAEHPARTMNESEAVFSLITWTNDDTIDRHRALPRRSRARPYLLWAAQLHWDMGEVRDLRKEEQDLLFVEFDLREQELMDDGAEPLPGVVFAPSLFWGGKAPDAARRKRFLASFLGRGHAGLHGSSSVRGNLERALGKLKRPDVVFELLKKKVKPKYDYTELMAETEFALCPRGHGRWSYRFSEALGAGSIPVIIADGLDLPYAEIINWSEAAVQVSEQLAAGTPGGDEADQGKLILEKLPSDPKVIQHMREKVIEINERYFSTQERRSVAMLLAAARRVENGVNARTSPFATKHTNFRRKTGKFGKKSRPAGEAGRPP